MLCPAFMLALVLLTQAIQEAGSVLLLVRRSLFNCGNSVTCQPYVGVLSDATKSVSRAYINNFQDKGKQVAIDMFLVCQSALPLYICVLMMISKGNISTQRQVTIFDPIHDLVRDTLDRRYGHPRFSSCFRTEACLEWVNTQVRSPALYSPERGT